MVYAHCSSDHVSSTPPLLLLQYVSYLQGMFFSTRHIWMSHVGCRMQQMFSKLTVTKQEGFVELAEAMLPLAPILHKTQENTENSCFLRSLYSDGDDFERTLTTDLRNHERHYFSHLDCGRVRVLRDPCFHRASPSSSQDSRNCNFLNSQQRCFRYEE